MTELQNLSCSRCGTTYAARYDTQRERLVLRCDPCGYDAMEFTDWGLRLLVDEQYQQLVRLAARTTEADRKANT